MDVPHFARIGGTLRVGIKDFSTGSRQHVGLWGPETAKGPSYHVARSPGRADRRRSPFAQRPCPGDNRSGNAHRCHRCRRRSRRGDAASRRAGGRPGGGGACRHRSRGARRGGGRPPRPATGSAAARRSGYPATRHRAGRRSRQDGGFSRAARRARSGPRASAGFAAVGGRRARLPVGRRAQQMFGMVNRRQVIPPTAPAILTARGSPCAFHAHTGRGLATGSCAPPAKRKGPGAVPGPFLVSFGVRRYSARAASVISWVKAPSGSAEMTGSDPPASRVATVRA